MENEAEIPAVRHPGAELGDMLARMDMTRQELALRAGVSEKHIDAVVAGSLDISLPFAKRLECAIGVSARKWMEMQLRYDESVFEQKERNRFHPDETEISLRFAPILPILRDCKLIGVPESDRDAIRTLRDFMGVSDLRAVPDIARHAVHRPLLRSIDGLDPFMLLVWRQMCERLTEPVPTAPRLSVPKLRDNILAVKHLMFYPEKGLAFHIAKTLAPCGVAFRLVRPFAGVPVRGYARRLGDGRCFLCLPIRPEPQDVFWRTLFREVSRIIDGNGNFTDFFGKDDAETYADECADELLIPAVRYRRLTANGDLSFDTVRRFAESQIVPEHILLARLIRDGFLEESEETRARLPEYTWEDI